MRLGSRAVVLGGSVAGLCAAGAVAPYFDEVLVLERDVLPREAQHRRGVPQSKHPHFLLNSGRRAMGHLFPGFEDALIAAGGLHMMPSMVTAHCDGWGWTPRTRTTLTMIYSSRVLVERVLRDKVRELSHVRLREDVAVRGITSTRGGEPDGRVTGVIVDDPSAPGGEQLIEADLVVDALGRGSGVAEWLREAGWPEVAVRTLDANVTYVSRWYQKPKSVPAAWWWQQMSILPTTDADPHPVEHDFLCQVFPIEGERVIVTMGSWGGDMPRADEEFVAAAEKVRAPAFAKAMHLCRPLSGVFLTRSTGNKWRRFDLLPHPPLGIVAIGDSICAFNPLYAQGMSSAALSAALLADRLATSTALDQAFVRGFVDAQRDCLNVAWTLALARDQGYEHATGTDTAPRWRQRLVARLSWPVFNLISAASGEDRAVERYFTGVFNLDRSVTELGRSPRVLFGLVRYAVRKALGRTKIPTGFDPQLDPPADDYSASFA